MKHLLTSIFLICIFGQTFGIISSSITTVTNQYWDLPTGSRIAFYFFKGHEPRKPVPIIYLHGGPGGYVTSQDLFVFSKLADDGYDVYLYDQIGSGRSARLRNIREYSVKRHLRDLEAIVDLLEASKVIFIGHSWGASLAPAYLAEHPEKVEKLIFSGPGGIIPKHLDDILIPLPDSVKLKNREITKHFPSEYLEPVAYKKFTRISDYAGFGIKTAPDDEIDSLLDCFMANIAKQKSERTGLSCSSSCERGSGGYAHFRTGLSLEKGKDRREFLHGLDTPVMILLGESDPIPWGCIADYLKVFRNIKLIIIPASGHSVFACQPEFCLKLTREFLSSPTK
ncbi:MAG TPA: alpha/beta hydrolase [Bacteroidales bacterium]|nr:alpha/beta hydrolase [Bacteroidales bacterium]HPS74702.1 alpha/beta hydrolase [Bacteroidales bacterium]